ncbi:MAG TPA: hypothetical protein VHT24_00165 [Pseudacidobacterium sp.]|jgi:hypothetical protein|nr:hypothetical protein [Pseudacidobacterium sp.]
MNRAQSAAFVLAMTMVLPGSVFAVPKPHVVGLGAVKKVPYSVTGDPDGAAADEKELRVRPLIVDGKVKEWTTGEAHDVTDRTFAVRRAIRLNDALPTDKTEHWVWQRGPWLLVDRVTGHVIAPKLPDYDPAVSRVVWFRDYAAYCGLTTSGKQLYAVVAQVAARKPVLAKKLGAWDAGDHPTPACAASTWQRDPLRVTFQPTGGAQVSYDLVGLSAVLVEDGDDSGDNN